MKTDNLWEAGVPAALFVGVVHLAIVAGAKFTADYRYKYHDLEGTTAWFISILRLTMFAAFVYNWRDTYYHQVDRQKASTSQLQVFLKQFLVAGALYFIYYPILLGVASIFAPYLRHKVMGFGTFLVQIICMMWLGKLFLSKGIFFKLSDMSRSFLPGTAWRTGYMN